MLTLQTPALLIDPGRRLAPGGKTGSTKEKDLEIEFRDVWSELSDGSLHMVRYFQRCSLAGGQYFQRRFLGTKLGLLLYALEPDAGFHHKVGMGKPLGLGSVKVEVLGYFRVDRGQRYTVAGLWRDAIRLVRWRRREERWWIQASGRSVTRWRLTLQ